MIGKIDRLAILSAAFFVLILRCTLIGAEDYYQNSKSRNAGGAGSDAVKREENAESISATMENGANSTMQYENELNTDSIARNISTILNSLLTSYDKRLRPNYGGEPVEVQVTIYVSTISAVSEVEMDFTIDMYLRQYWFDSRLAFNGSNESLTIGIDTVKDIWVPDTFFPNEKKSFFHDSTTHNGFLRIQPSGNILRSIRLTVTANCPMMLEYFPLDRQNCSVEIESYGYSTRDIVYAWRSDPAAVDLAPDINLAQFNITGYSKYSREINLSTGNYSRLSVHFTFRRNIGFYLIQIYLPSSLIVIISWVSFWLNREATQARVAIGVTTVLTMTTLMTSTNASMPKVSYIKSIDIYLGTCFIIVFASLLEYAAVGYLMKRMKMRRERAEQRRGVDALPAMMFGNAMASSSTSRPPIPFVGCLSADSKNSKNPTQQEYAGVARTQSDGAGAQEPQQRVPCSPALSACNTAAHANHAGVGLLWNRRPQGYQAIANPSYELLTVNSPGRQPLRKALLERRALSAGVLSCDCDVEMAVGIKDENISGSGSLANRRVRLRRRPSLRERGFRPSSIDKYSRIFFPLIFLIFHIIYWTVYLYTV